jgi:hypothetical protein
MSLTILLLTVRVEVALWALDRLGALGAGR